MPPWQIDGGRHPVQERRSLTDDHRLSPLGGRGARGGRRTCAKAWPDGQGELRGAVRPEGAGPGSSILRLTMPRCRRTWDKRVTPSGSRAALGAGDRIVPRPSRPRITSRDRVSRAVDRAAPGLRGRPRRSWNGRSAGRDDASRQAAVARVQFVGHPYSQAGEDRSKVSGITSKKGRAENRTRCRWPAALGCSTSVPIPSRWRRARPPRGSPHRELPGPHAPAR
jgi:hypothetical protein